MRPGHRRHGTPVALAAFTGVALLASWAWTWPLVAAGSTVEKGVGWPTHFPALLGPALAALVVTGWLAGRPGVAELRSRMLRWRLPLRWWAAALSPLAFLALALVIAAVSGDLPSLGEFGRYGGLPAIGLIPVAVLAIVVNGLGEETGWRGFALPRLQRRLGALGAALALGPIWALWHLPFFFCVSGFQDVGALGAVGFLFGLTCGSIVLTWLYNRSGASVLACAVWHALYNMTSATAPGPTPSPPSRVHS